MIIMIVKFNSKAGEDNLFDQEMKEEMEVAPKTTFNPKVLGTMKNLQAS